MRAVALGSSKRDTVVSGQLGPPTNLWGSSCAAPMVCRARFRLCAAPHRLCPKAGTQTARRASRHGIARLAQRVGHTLHMLLGTDCSPTCAPPSPLRFGSRWGGAFGCLWSHSHARVGQPCLWDMCWPHLLGMRTQGASSALSPETTCSPGASVVRFDSPSTAQPTSSVDPSLQCRLAKCLGPRHPGSVRSDTR